MKGFPFNCKRCGKEKVSRTSTRGTYCSNECKAAARRLPDGVRAQRKRAADLKYFKANREKIRAQRRRYYQENKATIALKTLRYREANKKRIALQDRRYLERNRERLLAYKRSYYRKNFKRAQALGRSYRKENHEHFKTYLRRRYWTGVYGQELGLTLWRLHQQTEALKAQVRGKE